MVEGCDVVVETLDVEPAQAEACRQTPADCCSFESGCDHQCCTEGASREWGDVARELCGVDHYAWGDGCVCLDVTPTSAQDERQVRDHECWSLMSNFASVKRFCSYADIDTCGKNLVFRVAWCCWMLIKQTYGW